MLSKKESSIGRILWKHNSFEQAVQIAFSATLAKFPTSQSFYGYNHTYHFQSKYHFSFCISLFTDVLLGGLIPETYELYINRLIPTGGVINSLANYIECVELGRKTQFSPAFRFITDMGTDSYESILAGGPSGVFYSGLYTSEIDRWNNHEYKTVQIVPNSEQKATKLEL